MRDLLQFCCDDKMLHNLFHEKLNENIETQLSRIEVSSTKKALSINVEPLQDSAEKKIGGRSDTSLQAHNVSGTTKSTLGLGRGYRGGNKSERKTTEDGASQGQMEPNFA